MIQYIGTLKKGDDTLKKEKINYKKTIGAAFVSSIPIIAGYIMLGMGFGILLSEKGYGPLWALFMSITMYAGSMQYVAVDLLASGASLISSATLSHEPSDIFPGL